jgi:hypothetical protein
MKFKKGDIVEVVFYPPWSGIALVAEVVGDDVYLIETFRAELKGAFPIRNLKPVTDAEALKWRLTN